MSRSTSRKALARAGRSRRRVESQEGIPLSGSGEPGGGDEVPQALCPLDVLMVEDSEDDALLAAEALRRGGFAPSFLRVETALEMRRALEMKSWQVILVDHYMPRFSAREALEVYCKVGLDIPFLIVSGVIGEESAVAAMKAGGARFSDEGPPGPAGSRRAARTGRS